MRFCRDGRMDDPDPLRLANGDQGRLTGAGGENLVSVDPGPAPQGDRLPVGQCAVLDHERPRLPDAAGQSGQGRLVEYGR